MDDNKKQRFKVIWRNFSGQFSNVLIFVAIVYFLVIVGRSMYGSYHDRQNINDKKAAIEDLKRQVVYLENQNLYYQTSSYKEKEARKKLGFIKPGESVVALDRTDGGKTVIVATKVEQPIEQPNYLKWWNYFFSKS
jgi:cell division protein FtsB